MEVNRFFTRSAHFFLLQIRSVPVKKIAISPETATFPVGKPSVGIGRPQASHRRNRAAGCPLPCPSPSRPVRLPDKGSDTGCQSHFAGRVPGRFFFQRAFWRGGRHPDGDPPDFLTILPTGLPRIHLNYKQPTENPTKPVGLGGSPQPEPAPSAPHCHFHTMLPRSRFPSVPSLPCLSSSDPAQTRCVPSCPLSVLHSQFATISPQTPPPVLPVRCPPGGQKKFPAPRQADRKNALRLVTQCVLMLGQPHSSSCLGTLWVMCSKSRTRWFSSLSNT